MFVAAPSRTTLLNSIIPPLQSQSLPSLFFASSPPTRHKQFHVKQTKWKKLLLPAKCTISNEESERYLKQELGLPTTTTRTNQEWNDKPDTSGQEALLRGGDQVTSVLEEMITLLKDMNMDEASEKVAVELAAQGVIGKRVDEMESGFMMALDYMIELAAKDQDDKGNPKSSLN
ncbi:Protein PEP-RELATED DEVELOPMENT ARRESTED 1, chloroplastic [Linum perenne]